MNMIIVLIHPNIYCLNLLLHFIYFTLISFYFVLFHNLYDIQVSSRDNEEEEEERQDSRINNSAQNEEEEQEGEEEEEEEGNEEGGFEEIIVGDVFNDLRGDKSYVTFKDIMKWDYVQMLTKVR